MRAPIDAQAVLELARAQGHGWVDEEVARRIAAAASVAVNTVAAVLPPATAAELLGASPAEFRDTLERLAGDEA